MSWRGRATSRTSGIICCTPSRASLQFAPVVVSSDTPLVIIANQQWPIDAVIVNFRRNFFSLEVSKGVIVQVTLLGLD